MNAGASWAQTVRLQLHQSIGRHLGDNKPSRPPTKLRVRAPGAGKSTLLSAIVGRTDVRSGDVFVKKGLRVGYLEQTAVAGANTTVRAEVLTWCYY